MKRRWITNVVALACLIVVGAAPVAHAQVRTVEIPFSSPGGLIVVEAKINGKTASLLFDSGAMRTFVNPSILDGLKVASGKAVSLADGKVVAVQVANTDISIGDASVQALVSAYDFTRFADGVGLHIDGVIGQDVIGKFSGVLIDYVRHRITLIK